jgi:hypothetical protein
MTSLSLSLSLVAAAESSKDVGHLYIRLLSSQQLSIIFSQLAVLTVIS